MLKKNTPDARNRILAAAHKVFAEKTFDGSRIEEISAEANVPKSLIYYHFKSKNEILEVLINDFLKEYVKIVKSSVCESNDEKSEGIANKLSNKYYEFAVKNSDLIRLLFMESLKKSEDKPIIFEIVKALVDTEEESLSVEAKGGFHRNERLVCEFFTNILPNCMVICLGDAFADYFNIEKKEFSSAYLRAIQLSHGAIHKNIEKEM